MPDFFHIVPVVDETMFDWRLDFKHSTFLLGLFTDINFFLVKTDHDTWNFWAAYHSGEDRPWCIIASEASLASA